MRDLRALYAPRALAKRDTIGVGRHVEAARAGSHVGCRNDTLRSIRVTSGVGVGLSAGDAGSHEGTTNLVMHVDAAPIGCERGAPAGCMGVSRLPQVGRTAGEGADQFSPGSIRIELCAPALVHQWACQGFRAMRGAGRSTSAYAGVQAIFTEERAVIHGHAKRPGDGHEKVTDVNGGRHVGVIANVDQNDLAASTFDALSQPPQFRAFANASKSRQELNAVIHVVDCLLEKLDGIALLNADNPLP